MTPSRSSNGFDPPASDARAGEATPCDRWQPALVEVARSAQEGSTQAISGEAVEALQHAASCPACRELLVAERAVTAELARLSSADSTLRPSVGCESTLLAAYRQERGGEVRTRRWIFAVAGTLAASLLILLGAALLVSRDSGSMAHAVVYRLLRGEVRPVSAVAAPDSGAQSAVEGGSSAATSDDEEEFTDFYAYYPGADLSSVDSGALVRVRVPSSELGAFGLQVAQGREDEWVNADLLVAEDGSPQAIRFVLPAPQSSKD